ncbi:MAG TPA: tetratricopeptide repeat protein, partial [Polyangiales bacterium]
IGLTELGAAGFFALQARLPEGGAERLAALGLAVYFGALALQLATVTHYYQNNQTLYGAAREAQPDAPYANEGLAAALLEAGRIDLAIPLFEHAAAQAPESPRYIRKLFAAYMLAGQPERARALIEAALPRFPVAQSGDLKALLIMTTHNSAPERTIEVLTDCLRHQPALAECRRWLPLLTATEHRHAQRYRAALEAYLQGGAP